MILNILLTITFVFGVVRLLTYTKLFKNELVGIIQIIIPHESKFLTYLDYLLFYFSLCFQASYWIFS